MEGCSVDVGGRSTATTQYLVEGLPQTAGLSTLFFDTVCPEP